MPTNTKAEVDQACARLLTGDIARALSASLMRRYASECAANHYIDARVSRHNEIIGSIVPVGRQRAILRHALQPRRV